MKNVEIRAAYMAHGIKQWELAKELGLSETHFSRKLRHELPPEEKECILAAIEKLAEETNGQTATGV